MLKVSVVKGFKKDVKRIVKSGSKDITKLKEIIGKLENEEKIDKSNRPRKLSSNWKDHIECHIESDWLLIYRVDRENNELILVRTGSHSELFG